MKNTAVILIAFLLLSFTGQAKNTHEKIATEIPVNIIEDKGFLLDFYIQTLSNLQRHMDGLTEKQLHYKPSDEEWSIAQCFEHIIIVEKALFEMSKEILNQNPNPEGREEIQMSDGELLENIINRGRKAKAPEAVQPMGQYDDIEAGMMEFENLRNEIMNLLEETPLEDMRYRVGESPMGLVDAYQSFLFIAGHTARHIQQIEEIKASPGYPTK